MTKKKINEFLERLVNDYQPIKSNDPAENECAVCTMSELAHKNKKMWDITCRNFQQVQ